MHDSINKQSCTNTCPNSEYLAVNYCPIYTLNVVRQFVKLVF